MQFKEYWQERQSLKRHDQQQQLASDEHARVSSSHIRGRELKIVDSSEASPGAYWKKELTPRLQKCTDFAI